MSTPTLEDPQALSSINAECIKQAKETRPSGINILELMRGWTSKHRPILARNLTYAINLHKDLHAYEHRVLFIMLEHQTEATKSAKRFKVILAEGMEIADLPEHKMPEIAKTLPDQLKVMGDEARKNHGCWGRELWC